MAAGPATDSAAARALLPSARQLVPIEGYMKSCVVGASGPKPGAAAGAAAGARSRRGCGGRGRAVLAPAGAAVAGQPVPAQAERRAPRREAGPAAWAGSIPDGRCDCRPGSMPAAGTCGAGACQVGSRRWVPEPAHRGTGGARLMDELVHRRGHVLGLGGRRRIVA